MARTPPRLFSAAQPQRAGARASASGPSPLPRRTALWLLLAFGVGAALATVLFAPARWLVGPLAQATGGRVQLVNVRGTVWNGQADVGLTGGAQSQDWTSLPGGLRWQLRPQWAAGPGLALALQAPCCTPQGLRLQARPSRSGLVLTAQAHRSSWPAGLLAGLGAPWNTLQLQGQLSLDTPGLELRWGSRGLQAHGTATVEVRDAASRLSTLRPMGSYRLHWQADAAAGAPATPARVSLETLEGALRLQGQGQWVAGRLRFEGHAEASPGREQALANLLNLLGRRQGARSLIKIG